MADYRLRLSDGVTTIDLYQGNQETLEGGLSMPVPSPQPSYLSSPFIDGDRISSFRYGNREIDISIKLDGSSLVDLKTNIRAIHRLLNDAVQRALRGYGDGVYLEYQWGDNANESTFFDVLRGDLIMPDDYLAAPLSAYSHIQPATLHLECEPFGRYTNQTIAKVDLENTQQVYDVATGYTVDGNNQHGVDGNNWEGQTFTPAANYTAVGAMIKCYRAGVLTNLTLSLYATAAGVPVGAPIATGTVDVSALNTGVAYRNWVRVIFGTPVALTNGTVYALVASSAVANPNFVYWRVDDTASCLVAGSRVWSNNAGGAWNIDATDDFTYAILEAMTDANYQNISPNEGYGDVPAKLYLRLDFLDPSVKTWIAKRTGDRYNDDLWTNSLDFSSLTDIVGAAITLHRLTTYEVSCANHFMESFLVEVGGVDIPVETEIARLNFNIATVPRGRFRVLARLNVICDDPNDYDHMSFGIGWVYGDHSYTPSEALGDYYTLAAHDTWQVIDLGLLKLPPILESDIDSNSPLELRLYFYCNSNGVLAATESYRYEVDYLMFLPVDEGLVIATAPSVGERLVMDGITDPPGIYQRSAGGLIEEALEYVGAPFALGRETTRIYVIQNATQSADCDSNIIYQPRFLVL